MDAHDEIESVQFTAWGPAHAVAGDEDRTACGQLATKANKMWGSWDDEPYKCKICVKRMAAR